MTPGSGFGAVSNTLSPHLGVRFVCSWLLITGQVTLVQVVMVGAGPTTLFITQEVNET